MISLTSVLTDDAGLGLDIGISLGLLAVSFLLIFFSLRKICNNQITQTFLYTQSFPEMFHASMETIERNTA